MRGVSCGVHPASFPSVLRPLRYAVTPGALHPLRYALPPLPLPPRRLRSTLHSLPTLLARAGADADDGPGEGPKNRPVSPPLHLSTTFTRPPSGEYGDGDYIYSRMDNPTRRLFEDALGAAEVAASRDLRGTELQEEPAVCAFGSGMAAVTSLLHAASSAAGVHVLIPGDCYHGTSAALRLAPPGTTHEAVAMSGRDGPEALREALGPAAVRAAEEGRNVVLWVETPSNPMCAVTDISGACAAAAAAEDAAGGRVVVAVDSTWSPPVITQPLLLGADVVVHSATKYISGHSDAVLGAACVGSASRHRDWLFPRLADVRSAWGAVPSPFDCWLALRGMRTLDVRMRRQCASAATLAVFLEGHPHVSAVHYPGLASHPGRSVARGQMADGLYGGMLSFEVAGGTAAEAHAVAAGLGIVHRATSLGGTESLIEHRASIEPEGQVVSPQGLLRLSVGLEDVEDLKEDLDNALNRAHDA